MRGLVYITNKKINSGKVLFKNDESGIIDFPSTFENNDIVEVEFRDNDINQRVTKMVAVSPIYHGFIMQKFSNTKGIVLATYPKIEGLVSFKNTDIKDKAKVSFRIKKTLDGKTEAISIKEVNKEDFYKCNTPIFGKLQTKTTTTKESFVIDVITTTKQKNMLSGKIKFIKQHFGFISGDDGEDYFFNTNSYEKFYNDSAKKNNKVNFISMKSSKGLQVKSFCNKEQNLVEDKQYIIINNQKIKINNYIKVYNQKPQLGDIVYYFENNGSIELKNEEQTINKIVLTQNQKQNQENIKTSKIKVVKDKFGFISGKPDIFFTMNSYKKIYNKEAKQGDIVSFISMKSEKGVSVKNFIQDEAIDVNKQSFKNFVEIENNCLYYSYIQNNSAKEVYKYNSDELSESISCYNDKKIEKRFKLLAIDCLIENNYTNKKISLEKLITEKNGIINSFIENSINDNDYESALEYEMKLQELNYKPNRVSRLTNIAPNKIEFLNDDINLRDINNNEKLNIMLDDIESIGFLETKEEYNIDLNSYNIEEIKDTQSWDIDLNQYITKQISHSDKFNFIKD
ncbi:MAG: hypothetical protein U9Q30_04840 [Campylobacterota bacterium]|nr:hypothetical protein [Campylobacterota bacterium]